MVLAGRYTDDKGDLFVKFFMIDSSENDRQWATTNEANERYARTAIGTPFTLMLNKEDSKFQDYHPFIPDDKEHSVKEEIDFAFQYAIGQIVDVSKESEQYKGAGYAANGDSPWFATVKITDPQAKQEFAKADSRLIPPAVSPGIIHLSGPDKAISEYHIVHLAAVPQGAYGPRAIKWASCNGDALSCIPKLKSASYKERTNCCVLESLSSLAQKSASSDTYNMSAVQPQSTPGPQSFGTGTIETTTPSSTNNQNQQTQNQKPTIRIRKQKQLSEEEEKENPEGEQENNGQNNNPNPNSQTEANPADQSFKSSRYYGELQSLKKELQNRTQQWDEREKRYQLEKIIPPQLFTDSRGRFNQKAWESEIQRAMKESASMELLAEYYATKLQAMQLPELKATATPTRRASSISMKSASSQDIDDEERERRMKLTELGKMIRGQR